MKQQDNNMAEDLKNTGEPEGRMELSFRVLGNEMIGIKMVVDDMKMKWVFIGLLGILIMTWAAAEFTNVITGVGSTGDDVYYEEPIDG